MPGFHAVICPSQRGIRDLLAAVMVGRKQRPDHTKPAGSIRSLFLVLKAGDPCWAFGKGDSSLTTLPPAGAWKGEKPGRPPHRVLWDPSSTSRLA